MRKDIDGDSSKFNVSPRPSRSCTNRLFSDILETELVSCDKHGSDHVLCKDMPDADGDEVLSCSYALPSVVLSNCCHAGQSLDCTQTNFFPALKDR